jgi:diguanylate cyclase (GGDEF)-like protein
MNTDQASLQAPSTAQALDLGLVQFDAAGCIEWLNDGMRELLAIGSRELTGAQPKQLDAPIRQLLEAEPQLLQVGENGKCYQRRMQSLNDGQKLLIVLDVTEHQRLIEDNARLLRQVEELCLTDELTGLPNKRAIGQALDQHISRSRRYHNPLSAVLVHVGTQSNADVQPMSIDPLILAVSRFLRDRLRWVDQVGRWDDNLFLAVLPETGIDDARRLLEKIHSEQDSLNVPDTFADARPTLSFGIGCWQKGDDLRTLLRSALQDLQNGDA